MKSTIKPLMIFAGMLISTGAIPYTAWYMPFIGLAVLACAIAVGNGVDAIQDREFNSQIEQMRLAVLQAREAAAQAKDAVVKAEEQANRASKAVSDVRSESSRLR